MQILSITITTIRSPTINKQLVAMKAPWPFGKASWVGGEHCSPSWVRLGAPSWAVFLLGVALLPSADTAQQFWVSTFHQPRAEPFPATFALTHQWHVIRPFIPLPLPHMAGKVWWWFSCQSPPKDMEGSFVFVGSKIKDRIKKRPGMDPFSIWLTLWTLLC